MGQRVIAAADLPPFSCKVMRADLIMLGMLLVPFGLVMPLLAQPTWMEDLAKTPGAGMGP